MSGTTDSIRQPSMRASFLVVLSTVKTLSAKQISPMLFSIFQQMWGVGSSILIKLITSAQLMGSRRRASPTRFALGMTKLLIVTKKTGITDYLRETVAVNGKIAFDYDHRAGKVLDGDLASIGADRLNWEFKSPGISVLAYVCNNIPFERAMPLFKLYTFARSMDAIGDAHMNDRNLVSTIAENVISNDLVSELQAFLNDFGIRERLTARETPSGDIALYFEKVDLFRL